MAEKLVSHNIPNSLLTHSQEEANTLLILHAVTVPCKDRQIDKLYFTKVKPIKYEYLFTIGPSNFVVRSHTPEVLLLLVKMYPHLPVSVFFSGKGRLKRNIGVGNIQKHFGQQGVSGL